MENHNSHSSTLHHNITQGHSQHFYTHNSHTNTHLTHTLTPFQITE
ncbi:hypothetical protein LINPERHAP2_LOCUS22856 [Linum perenne]